MKLLLRNNIQFSKRTNRIWNGTYNISFQSRYGSVPDMIIFTSLHGDSFSVELTILDCVNILYNLIKMKIRSYYK